jgi:hypothetical protein
MAHELEKQDWGDRRIGFAECSLVAITEMYRVQTSLDFGRFGGAAIIIGKLWIFFAPTA